MVNIGITFAIILLFAIPFLNAEKRMEQDFIDIPHPKIGVLPYAQSGFGQGIPYGNIQGFPGFGLQGVNGLQTGGNLYGGLNGIGGAEYGYHDNHGFGKQGFGKGIGGAGYGVQDGFGGLYGAKGSYNDQFIGGNSNTFAKEKVFSQNKNFGSGLKGGFGTGYGVHGGLYGQGGYGGYGGLGSLGQAGFGNQGLYGAGGLGAGGYGHLGHNAAALHGNGITTG